MSDDCKLFEVGFLASSGFPMAEGQELHLVMTNVAEFRTALDQGWASAQEIVDAVRSGDYQVLHADRVGEEVLGWIQQMAKSGQGVGHG